MFTKAQLAIIARLLYIAMAYGSRSTRVRAMLSTNDIDVSMLATQLKYAGYMKDDSIETNPK